MVIPTHETLCTNLFGTTTPEAPVTLSPVGHPQLTEHQQAERSDSYQAVAAQLPVPMSPGPGP